MHIIQRISRAVMLRAFKSENDFSSSWIFKRFSFTLSITASDFEVTESRTITQTKFTIQMLRRAFPYLRSSPLSCWLMVRHSKVHCLFHVAGRAAKAIQLRSNFFVFNRRNEISAAFYSFLPKRCDCQRKMCARNSRTRYKRARATNGTHCTLHKHIHFTCSQCPSSCTKIKFIRPEMQNTMNA